jgi:hypothetical protein
MFHVSCDVHGRGKWLYFVEAVVGMYFIFMMDMFLLFCQIWDYVYL